MTSYSWLIPIFPLIGFVINAMWKKQIAGKTAGTIASTAVLLSFLCTLGLFFQTSSPTTVEIGSWINAGKLSVPFELLIDPLSVTMMLIVTGIGFLIHVYSIGYMHEDENCTTFFSYLNLFMFSMLVLVMGANYVMMFIGWEGVGLCSYLLIGFWFKNNNYNNAGRKAFIMNRIGDLGFLLGIFLLFSTFGSTSFASIFPAAGKLASGNPTITLATIFLLIGAMGKSAQIPLYTWLPDAMAGPTPVSALIHAATMVTAGIYMIVRSNVLYSLAPLTSEIIVVIGLATALFAASIGLFQNDIKKVLAYSTVSQLGYMFIALGLGAYSTAIFHVATHAFFKALLFLGAGSVIHALHGEQDIRNMGGLKKHIPTTYITFLIATLAISGIPPFSGFFSKDEILAKAFEHNPLVWGLALLGAAMTTFYMFRLLFLTFFGTFRGTEHQAKHMHESPKVMTIPLMVLAVLSVLGGALNLPALVGGGSSLQHYLSPSIISQKMESGELSSSTEFALIGVSLAVIALMFFLAYSKFVKKQQVPQAEDQTLPGVQRVIYNKYFIDEIYNAVFVQPYNFISKTVLTSLENVTDTIAEGTGDVWLWSSQYLRKLQNGNTSFYLFGMVLAVIFIIFLNDYFL